MTHFGLICPASSGHLNTMLPLGKELQRRGHLVTMISLLDAQEKALAAGLEFQALNEAKYPLGSSAELLETLGKLSGMEAVKFTSDLIGEGAEALLRELPQTLKDLGVEALLVDQASPGAGTVADFLDIPFVSICSAVILNAEASIPPSFTTWKYRKVWWAKWRNALTYLAFKRVIRSIQTITNEYRKKWDLPLHSTFNDSFSSLAQISQQPAELEFPREKLPKCLHFVGPFHSAIGRNIADFPFDKLTGQPLIYASMGTIQNRLLDTFYKIAEACADLDAQLVISLGGSASPDVLPNLPGSPIVVGYAPQLELLKKATLTITHAGMNTTLESLNQGVPMVAIPITNDQPGVATRIAWTGAGELIPVKKLTTKKLKKAIDLVLTNPSYRAATERLQGVIARAGGVTRAADIVEQAVLTKKPVLAKR
ncbi:MAG: glycosyltransferase [Cyanobacteria bacterium P01_D01_bin.73]